MARRSKKNKSRKPQANAGPTKANHASRGVRDPIRKRFDAIDANHDGSIDPKEWRAYCEKNAGGAQKAPTNQARQQQVKKSANRRARSTRGTRSSSLKSVQEEPKDNTRGSWSESWAAQAKAEKGRRAGPRRHYTPNASVSDETEASPKQVYSKLNPYVKPWKPAAPQAPMITRTYNDPALRFDRATGSYTGSNGVVYGRASGSPRRSSGSPRRSSGPPPGLNRSPRSSNASRWSAFSRAERQSLDLDLDLSMPSASFGHNPYAAPEPRMSPGLARALAAKQEDINNPAVEIDPSVPDESHKSTEDGAWVFYWAQPVHRQQHGTVNDYLGSITEMGRFEGIENFWQTVGDIRAPSQFPPAQGRHTYLIFREGLKPVWESFPKGGNWVVNFPRHRNNPLFRNIDDVWQSLLFSLVSEGFPDSKEIVGATLHIRQNNYRMTIWNRDNSTGSKIRFDIAEALKVKLNLGPRTLLHYKNFTKCIKDGSTTSVDNDQETYRFTRVQPVAY